MEKEVRITVEESEHVYGLFMEYNAYIAILGYIGTHAEYDSDTTIFNEKWAEAVKLYRTLDEAKREIEKKYRPEGQWSHFQFKFENYSVVFYA